MRRQYFRCFVLTLVLALPQSLLAAEWQTLKEGSHRLEDEKTSKEQAPKPTTVPIPEDHYEPGQGTIDGAFGLLFGNVLEASHIVKSLGWQTPERLPTDLKYRGLVQPLTVEKLQLRPPLIPAPLAAQNVSFWAFVDFEQHPIAIGTSAFADAEEIIEIIKRKYGEPDEVEEGRSTYVRGQYRLHIYSKHQTSASLVYEDVESYRLYLAERNRSLKRKFRNREFSRLSPTEEIVVDIAKELETFRQGTGKAFGLEFGKRVGFKAAPDEFVDFPAPEPLGTLGGGDYKVMVSPDLMPIAIRYEKKGDEDDLGMTKQLVELAMELAFAGFLKQSPNHTVVSFNEHAYSLLIRNGQFNFTIHDRDENTARNDRVKQAKVAAAEARKEQERLAELERQRQAIAARQKQIDEEKAF